VVEVVGNPKDLEKSTITVGALDTLDPATLRLGVSEGFFSREGLNVRIVKINAGPIGMDNITAGVTDITFSSYSPAFLAEKKGVGRNVGNYKIIAAATSLIEKNSMIMVPKDSPVREPRELRGKRVAVVGINTMAHMLTLNTLYQNDVQPHEVEYVQASFPDTLGLLDNNKVDAAFMTEPFVTMAGATTGARVLTDTYQGFNEGIPLCGYVATGNWVKENPKTVAAFSRGMQRATDLALTDRGKVEDILSRTGPKIDRGLAGIITYTQYEKTLIAPDLQKVVTLMDQFNIFGDAATREDTWDMAHMIVPPAPTTRPVN
jgi:NitT/TauT family transport system substrate-binding protein